MWLGKAIHVTCNCTIGHTPSPAVRLFNQCKYILCIYVFPIYQSKKNMIVFWYDHVNKFVIMVLNIVSILK